MRRTLTHALLVTTVIACQQDAPRDSASSASSSGALALGSAPALVIGGASEERLYQVTGAVLLDELVAVANAGTKEVLLYDRTGRFIRATGREGAGPGEFRSISGMWRYRADSLLVWDGLLARFAVLAPDGRWVRSGQLEQTQRFPTPQLQGAFQDGSVFAIANTFVPNPAPGMHDYGMDVVRFGPEGHFSNVLLTGAPSFSLFRGAAPFSWPTPAGGNRRFAIRGCTLVTGYSTTDTLQAVGCDGSLQEELVLGLARRVLPRPDAEAMRTRMLDALRARVERGQVSAAQASPQRQFLEEVPIPDLLPAYAETYADPTGRLWVLEYPSPGDSSRVVHVFGTDGARIGEVRLPDGSRILDIGLGEIAILRRNDDGVERIEVYLLST